MSAAAKILDRLQRVKQTRAGNYLAACPCCQSKRGRPISVRELDDGRVLLYPFCGCETGVVLEALGLTLSDLFPDGCLGELKATHSGIPARDLLEVVSEEVTKVAVIAADMLERKAISDADWQLLARAAARIGQARDHAHGG
jgi:hypothetical protein